MDINIVAECITVKLASENASSVETSEETTSVESSDALVIKEHCKADYPLTSVLFSL